MGFESITNSITTYFLDVCDTNSLTVRFSNDPRATPTSGLWLEFNIDFGNSEQKELGINSYRNPGNVTVKIKNSIGLGVGGVLEVADVIASAFRTVDIDSIIFRVPRIINVGRIEDNYQMNVICPFFVDN